jgi:AraC-like DNA-binding protein
VSEKLLVQTNYFTDYLVNWTATSGRHLYRDTDIFNLMYGKKISYTDEVVGKRKLNLSIPVIPFTHSIYVYNGVNKIFYSSISEPTYLRDFYDREIISLLENRKQYANTRLIPRKVFFSVDGLKGLSYKGNILTIIISDYPVQDGLDDGALILNLDAREIQNVFKNISPKNSDIFIIDGAGNIVSHSDPQMFMQNVSEHKHIKNILSAKKNRGYLIDVVDGKKSLITYVTSEKLDLKFISVIPYNSLLKDLNAMTHLTIIISIILLIIGILLSYFFSKRIYFPIHKIVKNIQEHLSKQKNKNTSIENNRIDELDYLSNVLDGLLHHTLSLENLSQIDINFVKQQLLKGVLLNTSNQIKDLDIKFTELNINITPQNLFVYVLRIDSYKEFYSKYSKENMDLLRFAIGNIASEITSRNYPCDTVDMGDDHIAVILNVSEKEYPQTMNILLNSIEEIQNAVSQYLEVSVTAGIGNWVKDLTDASLSYKTAYDYTHYRFKYGPKSILFHDKIVNDINEDYRYPEEKETNIFNALKLGHLKDVECALSEMLNEIKQYSYKDMLLAITQLTINSKKLLKVLYNIDHENIYIDIRSFRKNLEMFENIEEIKHWLLDLYTNTIQQREEKKSNRKEEIVNAAIDYIEYNYSNPSLSPELIADYVNISPNYLRSIFKEVKNESLSAFINEYRLKKARHLLETTNLTVSEISNSIGYSNSTYFYTAYKKFYGITPNQYRKIILYNQTEKIGTEID